MTLRGSMQDITDQRQVDQELADAAAVREASAREHRIADELQSSLLPEPTFDPEHLEVATYYRAGVEGTQVGGDWYDVIELGAGRTALVIGDVMGRGVRAAAVMGQLWSAIRAYARLDLPPVLAAPGQPARWLTGVASPPLGSGPMTVVESRFELPVGAVVALYADGLVERRDRDLDAGVAALGAELVDQAGGLLPAPATLVKALLPDGPDDDVAVLLAKVSEASVRQASAARQVPMDRAAVSEARAFVTGTLAGWGIGPEPASDAALLATELVTNAVLHGRAPVEMRLRRTDNHLVTEVCDAALLLLPRRLRPTADDEGGRGLHIVARLADRWGARPTATGKSVWCTIGVGATAP